VAHALWVNVFRGGHAPEHEQVVVARIASVILGVVAVLLGILFQGQNVAYMVGLTFSIAASANFPALILSVFWRKFTTWGAVASILFGTFGTLFLIYMGPTIQLDLLFGKVGDPISAAKAAKFASIPGLAGFVEGTKITADQLAAYASYIKTLPWWSGGFPLKNPCLITMLGAFAIGIIVSLLTPERSASEGFTEVERRAILG
jgi:cation/acetate symporter